MGDLVIKNKVEPQRSGQPFARKIVVRRSKSASGNDHIRASKRAFKSSRNLRDFVAHGLRANDSDAQRQQLLRNIRAIGVDNLAEEKFVADGKERCAGRKHG